MAMECIMGDAALNTAQGHGGYRAEAKAWGQVTGTRPRRHVRDTTRHGDRTQGRDRGTGHTDTTRTSPAPGKAAATRAGPWRGTPLMLMRAESRSADRCRRAGRAQPGGTEGGARGGHPSRTASAAKRRRCGLGARGAARMPRASPAAAPRERDRGARRRSEERTSGRPPCRAHGVRRGRGGRGWWVRSRDGRLAAILSCGGRI